MTAENQETATQETTTQVWRTPKVCPLKFNSNTVDSEGHLLIDRCPCEGEACALWNPHFAVCALSRIGMYQ